MLTSNDALNLLYCDDSDEDTLFDMDAEDETVLAQNVPTSELNDPVTSVEIVDPNTVLPEPIENNMPLWDIEFKWSKRFPHVWPVNEELPNEREWENVLLQYESLPSPCQVFQDTCKLDSLLDNILVPQSIIYIHQKGKPFDIEKDEMFAFIGMNIMMSYHMLPEIHDYFSKESDLQDDPIANAMSRKPFFIQLELHCITPTTLNVQTGVIHCMIRPGKSDR